MTEEYNELIAEEKILGLPGYKERMKEQSEATPSEEP